MNLIHHPELTDRAELALICNRRDLRDAAEIGTDCGAFARDFLQLWKGAFLYCVDPYVRCDFYQWDREPDLAMAIQALAPFAGRVRIVRACSVNAVGLIPGQVGFCYIDANHDYGSVRQDLAAWWPMVRDGGILAGHDYDLQHHEVMRAVDEFAADHDFPVHLIEAGASWWIDKPRGVA